MSSIRQETTAVRTAETESAMSTDLTTVHAIRSADTTYCGESRNRKDDAPFRIAGLWRNVTCPECLSYKPGGGESGITHSARNSHYTVCGLQRTDHDLTLRVKLDDVTCPGCRGAFPEEPEKPKQVDHDAQKKQTRRVYEHDCDLCVHLGQTTVNGTEHDLYYCPNPAGKSVIARYGDDGEDYISGLAFTTLEPALAMALVRALKAKLITFEDALRPL